MLIQSEAGFTGRAEFSSIRVTVGDVLTRVRTLAVRDSLSRVRALSAVEGINTLRAAIDDVTGVTLAIMSFVETSVAALALVIAVGPNETFRLDLVRNLAVVQLL